MGPYRVAKPGILRSIGYFATAGVLAGCICLNLWQIDLNQTGVPPLGVFDNIVVREDQFRPIQNVLLNQKYRSGYLAYMTNRSLRGEARTFNDDLHWVQLRYLAIPLMLVRDIPDTPYVLGDFTDDSVPEDPKGLIKVYDPGNGLILYKRIQAP